MCVSQDESARTGTFVSTHFTELSLSRLELTQGDPFTSDCNNCQVFNWKPELSDPSHVKYVADVLF